MKTKWFWIGIFLCTAIAFLAVLVPAWIIQPFKTQTSQGVEISFLARRWSPVVTIFALAGNLILAASLLRRANKWWKKTGAVLLVLISGICVWFARQNYFEWMFRPLPDAAYLPASEQKFVGANDMVLGMNINRDAVAYPVRLLAYHHLVNDTVGGKPIVATY